MNQVKGDQKKVSENERIRPFDWVTWVERSIFALIKKWAPNLCVRLALGIVAVATMMSLFMVWIQVSVLGYYLEKHTMEELLSSINKGAGEASLWLLWTVSVGWTFGLVLFFSLLGWLFLKREVLKPLEVMTDAARKRKHGDRADFVPHSLLPLTEMGNLGRILNDCFDRLAENHAEIRQLAQVVNSTQNAVILTDKEGRIEWVNAGFSHQFGYSMLEVLGLRPEALLSGKDTSQEITEKLDKGILLGHGFDSEVVHYDKDGASHLMSVELRPLRDEQGTLEGGMLIETDISEFKDKVRELREAQEDACKPS